MRKNVTEQLRRMFRPEFLNRVDATIVFRSLTKDEIKQIVDLELNKVRERLIEHAITLEMTDEARDWLADKGYDPEYGARPLRRLIQNEIEDALSDGILSGDVPPRRDRPRDDPRRRTGAGKRRGRRTKNSKRPASKRNSVEIRTGESATCPF